MELVARELIRALRGPRSQVQLSRRLGYRSNPVAEWEGGRRWPSAAELVRVCRIAGVDVAAAIERFHPPAAAAFGDPEAPRIGPWLAALRGDQAIGSIAAALGRSRSAVSRWLAGRTAIDVPDLLAVVDVLTGRVVDLVAALVPIEAVPSLAPSWERAQRARRLLFDHPWALAVLACVQTRDFRGGAEAVAAALALDEGTAAACLAALVETGVLTRGADGWAAAPDRLVVDTAAVPGGADRLRRHWLEVALARLEARGPDDQFGYAVFSVSADDLARIRELHRAYYRQVRAIASASSPTDAVVLLNLQLLALGPTARPR